MHFAEAEQKYLELEGQLLGGDLSEDDFLAQVAQLRVTDEELEVWDEGLVVTVAANLDGVEGVRTIDYGTVLARWAEAVPEGSSQQARHWDLYHWAQQQWRSCSSLAYSWSG